MDGGVGGCKSSGEAKQREHCWSILRIMNINSSRSKRFKERESSILDCRRNPRLLLVSSFVDYVVVLTEEN